MSNSTLTKKILYWYDNNKRVLPWRKKTSQTKREYFTLVSEFMLQQTQVVTVIPYFNRFIKNIPDLETLASFENRKLIKFWEGLGYYSRVRNLKKTAQVIIKDFNKKGHIYSETLSNWKYIVGDNLFKVCYPKSFKNSNRFGVSTLLIMVKRGHEVDLEYSKKEIIDKMNSFFGYSVVEKLKFISFDNDQKSDIFNKVIQKNEAIKKYQNQIDSIKNEKIRKSLIELTYVFKKK